MSTVYHESGLSPEAQDVHRALASLIEELEAIDWYNQRADVTRDEALKAILLHNRNEEIEHATMALEWLRRRIANFDQELRTYLFTSAPVTEVEETAGGPDGGKDEPKQAGSSSGSLGIGNPARKKVG
jgi:ferritin-like protein